MIPKKLPDPDGLLLEILPSSTIKAANEAVLDNPSQSKHPNSARGVQT